MEHRYVADPLSDGDQLLRPDGIHSLYRLGRSSVDDRLLLRRPDLSFRRILSVGTDALVLEVVAFPDPGCTGNVGLCEAQFDGGFDGGDTYGIYYTMDTVRRLFRAVMPGVPI